MGGVNPWFILVLLALAALILKGYIPLSLSGLSRPAPASPPSGGSPPAARLDEVDADTLGMAYARAKRKQAEEKVVKAIVDTAGKTIEEAFTAPFAGADPGKNRPEDLPF